MTREILRVDITGIQVKKNLLIGNLWFDPWNIYIDDYVFRDGDIVVVDGGDREAYIDMDGEYLIELAYGV